MAGRKKSDKTERKKTVTIVLKPSQIEWLKQQGGISATISKLISEKVNDDSGFN